MRFCAKEATAPFILRRLIPFFVLFFAHPTWPQSLRPSHWTDPSIAFLQHRGYLWRLSPLTRPYHADPVLNLVEKEAGSSSDATRLAYEHALVLRDYLKQTTLQSGEAGVAIESFHEGSGGQALFQYHGIQRLNLAFKPAPWLEVYNTMLFDNRLDEAPAYLGIRQSGYAGYTEQAYVRAHHGGFSAGFGRDYLRFGPGADAALLLSDYARPLDHLELGYHYKWLTYRFITATLNATGYAIDGAPGHQNRYLTLHHLQISPLENLHIGIGEAILFGGPDAGLDFAYFNPFLSYHGEQMNGPSGGNTMGSIHLAALLKKRWFIHADLLIDDVQLEKTGPGDLEPNAYGLLCGINGADPLGIRGADVMLEYTRITNRTYNGQGGPWEKWLHRNQPLGHFLGNDFDRLQCAISWWPVSRWRAQLHFEYRRRGEGRIEKPFDTPWEEVPLGGSYSEPFPTGVVEKMQRWQLDVQYQRAWWLRLFAATAHQNITNHENQRGTGLSEWRFRCGFDCSLRKKFEL